jgi:hypothetical protein
MRATDWQKSKLIDSVCLSYVHQERYFIGPRSNKQTDEETRGIGERLETKERGIREEKSGEGAFEGIWFSLT